MSTVLYPPLIRSRVRAGIDEAVALARRLDREVLYSHVEPAPHEPDPIAFLAASSRELGNGVLWAQPAAGLALAGAGLATTLVADGERRFRDVSMSVADARQRLVFGGAPAPFPFIGGFAFAAKVSRESQWAAFPGAWLVAPMVLLHKGRAETFLRVTITLNASADPQRFESEVDALLRRGRRWAEATIDVQDGARTAIFESIPRPEEWKSSVADAVEEIRQGNLDKVVLARETRLYATEPFSPIAALHRLGASQPDATLFAMQSDGYWFIGGTPERLVKLEDGQASVTCLAGSVGGGRTIEERFALARRLLASEKDRLEHDYVVRGTIEALAGTVTSAIRNAEHPRVVFARSVQHLETSITAQVEPGIGVLDLVERLHPTPAVGGYPRERALDALCRLESIDRGWYAAPFGWVGLDGAGEFAVAIRSALLSGHTASLFAGSGIVAGSDPEAELAETDLKMRTMLAALGVE